MRQFERKLPTFDDPLGEALYLLRLNGSLYCHSDLYAPWGLEMPEMPGDMMFHILLSGQYWISVEGQNPIHLSKGSLALVTRGQGHTLYSNQGSACKHLFDLPIQKISDRYEYLEYGGSGEKTSLLCGVISMDKLSGRKLIEQLPEVIHLHQHDADNPTWINSIVELISAEAENTMAGGETVMAHLSDIVVIKAIRHWINTATEAQFGWLGALRDPKLGKALSAIHNQPAESWTVDTLAQTAGMSRSGFAARFKEVVGTSAKQYLTHWRMTMAKSQLGSGSLSLGELSEQLGYQSEAAFSRAYKRIIGESPVRKLK